MNADHPFLAIPTFRSMKLLHGILWIGATWILVSLGTVHFLVLPGNEGNPEVAFLRWALLMAGFVLVPVMALGYRMVSTNQY